jgi:hypothetical protein
MVGIEDVADVPKLKPMILASYETELAPVGDPAEPAPAGGPA